MKLKSSVYAPILFGVVMVLVGFSQQLVALVNRVSEDAFLSVAIIQFLVYLLPVAFYCRVFNINFVSSLKFRGFSWKKLPLACTLLLLFLVGSAVLRYFGIFFFDGAMLNTPDAVFIPIYSDNRFLTVLCFMIIPALLEEILFRGIILEEYARYGAFFAVSVSAIAFAMLHASLENFFYYLFMGLVFGSLTWICDSLFPAIVFHLLKNFLYFYSADAITDYIRQAGKSALLPYLLIAVLILLLFSLFSQMEGLYRDRARDDMRQTRKELLKREAAAEKKNAVAAKQNYFITLREIFLSPTFLIVVFIFVLQALQIL